MAMLNNQMVIYLTPQKCFLHFRLIHDPKPSRSDIVNSWQPNQICG